MNRSRRSGVTLRDVARAAQVGEATAARALGGYGSVSPATRVRVVAAAQAIGYVPNAVARALASGATRTVGLVVGDIENPFFASAARAMSNVLERAGFTLLLANSDESIEGERRMVASLLEHRVDGLAVVPASSEHQGFLTDLVESGVPLVLMDRPILRLPADTVMVDNIAASHRAVTHLIHQGRNRITVVVDSLDIVTSQERLEGARRALSDVGQDLGEDQVVVAGITPQEANTAILPILEGRHRPDAIFAISNFMTQGAVTALRETPIRIPQEMALVGFDDPDWATLVAPTVTVVAQPVARLGEVTARRLLRRVEGDRTAARTIRLECNLIIRESSASS